MRIAKAKTYDAYARLPGITATSIKAGAVSMLHMRHALTGEPPPPREETPAMRWGRLVHAAVLEPVQYGRLAAVWDGRRAGGEYEAFIADHGPEWIVKPDENAELLSISAAIHGNREAHRLIAGTRHELAVTWTDRLYGKAKARLDGYDKRLGIVDLKTCRNLAAFPRAFFNYHYDLQFGWYAEGTGATRAACIAAEAGAPYDVAVYEISADMLAGWRTAAVEVAKRYHASEVCGSFGGVVEGGVAALPIPAWIAGAGGGDVELTVGGEKVKA